MHKDLTKKITQTSLNYGLKVGLVLNYLGVKAIDYINEYYSSLA